MRPLLRRVLRGAQDRVRHVTPVPYAAATGRVAAIYRQVERDFGMLAPPVSLHSPAPDTLAAAWTLLRETLLAGEPGARAVREAVATEVSRRNACPYCVEVHGATLAALGETGPIRSRSPELAAVAVTFEYLNRMVNVFLGESPLPPTVPERGRGPARRLIGWMARPRGVVRPGEALGFLPEAPWPDDLDWARGTGSAGQALVRACAAVEEAGLRSVPERVRELVRTELAGWTGEPPGLGRAWATAATAALPHHERAAGTLALLVAKASYQVGDGAVAGLGERELVELTAWASLTAARHAAGRWLEPVSTGTNERKGQQWTSSG